MRRRFEGENLAFHAARVLLLIHRCGSPRGERERLPGLRGRTLLAKLDFFLRYPSYLRKAVEVRAEDQGRAEEAPVGPDVDAVESRMVRYLYGPWDELYYAVLSYLIGKRLIVVEVLRGVETFRLTERGRDTAEKLAADPAYATVVRRAGILARIFPRFGGTQLKQFIYEHFPEIVSRKIGSAI